MSTHPADFRVEIIKGRPQGVEGIYFQIVGSLEVEFKKALDPPGEVVDITDRVLRDGFGSINRAVDRDLLTFKTGDLTLTARNHDGFFDDLFAFFTPTTIWGLRVYRRGEVQFYGAIVGVGSVAFDRKPRTCEITAYGLTKLLDMTDATLVRRAFAIMSVTTATATQSTMTLDSTFNLMTGDVLHLTDHVNSEDVTVKQVTSGTVVQLESALAHSYAAGSPVKCTTPFHRYRTISYLAERLFTAAFIGLADLRLSPSQFKTLAPTPVNLQGLTLTANARRGCYQYQGKWGIALAAVDSYTQQNPEDAWSVQGLTDKGIYDWQPYYSQGFWPGGPIVGTDEPMAIFEPIAGATQEGSAGAKFMTWWGAADYISATKRIWGFNFSTAPAPNLQERTTVDGVTYTGVTTLALPADNDVSGLEAGCEYDPVRNFTHVSWKARTNTNRHFRYRDWGGAAWVDCKQAGDAATTGYYGPRYIADLDYTLVLKNATASSTGPDFTICAFRGAALLWERPFPSCLIAQDVVGHPAFYPTRTARFINGSIYIALVSDGAVQLVRTDDEFQSYTMRKIAPGTSNTIIMATRIGSTYRIACYKGADAKGYFICAPFYAGVIEYADFTGLSAAEALKKLAVLCNAVFSVDDDLQGSFVARDRYDPGDVLDIQDRIKEWKETPVWDQTVQYAKISGNGVEATAGDASFAAEGIELESSFLPNEATAQSLADNYYEFLSQKRAFLELVLHDRDGTVFRPLKRVTPDGARRFFVQESDHSLMDDEIPSSYVEDR